MTTPADKEREQALKAIARAEARLSRARAELLGATVERAQAVKAAGDLGLSRREVAQHLGLSPGRVQQLIDEAEKTGGIHTVMKPNRTWTTMIGRGTAGAHTSREAAIREARDLAQLAGVDHVIHDESGAIEEVHSHTGQPRQATGSGHSETR
jgi:DNA-binding transcriptional regulator LsrR (DeoR family)